MNKIGLVISREYFTRVKKKSFLLTTIGVPLVIIAFYALIVYIAVSGGSSGKSKIAIIDEAGLLEQTSSNTRSIEYTIIKDKSVADYQKEYKKDGYKALLYVPAMNLDTPKNIVVYSEKTVPFRVSSRIEKMLDEAIENKRMAELGIDPNVYKQIKSDINIINTIESEDGEKTSSAGIAYAMSYICGFLIYIMMLIYGSMVMRGVMEEKTNRIAEVIVSSVKPFQLMLGKIIGIGAVGLTQFAVWIVLFLLIQMAIPFIFPELMDQVNNIQQNAVAMNEVAGNSEMAAIVQGLSALPLLKIFLLFLFYFLGGYLLYASLFAAIGSVVSDDQNEAQQLVFPVMMPIILSFVMLTQTVEDPNSGMAIFGSIFPLTSPIVMMGRITFDVPLYQLLISMALLIATFLFFTWIAGKIYRTGILLYGKKPSWKEMMKWVFRKS
jgi:ABC-2 type transport system permease protein